MHIAYDSINIPPSLQANLTFITRPSLILLPNIRNNKTFKGTNKSLECDRAPKWSVSRLKLLKNKFPS